MSRKSQVKEIIDAYIHRNGNQEITGNILNGVLVALLDAGVIDIIQDGAILPKDEDGNVVIPDFSMDGAVRYDIEQTLTEIEKELARRNIGAVDANFVGREVQDVYSALAGMITSEKNRAIGVENGLRSDLTDEIQRASTEELRIAGLVGALYTNAQIDAFLAPKMERVELAMIASQTPLKITYKGQTTALTFEQIKALVQNTAKFVTLLVDDAYYLIPSLDYYDDAVQFIGTNILTGQAEAVRVMINSSNVVSCYAIELEDSGHKVSSMENILPYDQYIKYPNVKAVIDYVSAHGGGLTPEQEQKLNDAATTDYVDSRHVVMEVELGEETEEGRIPILNAEELLKKIQNAPEGASFYIKDGEITAEATMKMPFVSEENYILCCYVVNEVRQYVFMHDDEQGIYDGFMQSARFASESKIGDLQSRVDEIENSVDGKQDKDKMQSVITESSTNYPSSKAVVDYAAKKSELTELLVKVGKFSEITPTLSSGVQIATLKKEVEGQEVETPLYAPQGGSGSDLPLSVVNGKLCITFNA